FRTNFFFHIDDPEIIGAGRKAWIVHSVKARISDPGYSAFPSDQAIDVVSHAMKFLRSNHKIEMWDFFQQLRASCLRHAAKKSKDGLRPAFCDAAEHSHFAQRL